MVSLDTLDEEKRETLTQFQTITQTTDLDEALGQLIEHDWNLEKAVQHVYENKPSTDTRQELEDQVASSSSSSSTITNNNNNHHINHKSTISNTSNTINNTFKTKRTRPTTFLSILFWPFGIAWNITWSILSLASRILSRPAITNKPRDPRVLAFEYIERFEEKYGPHHVEFFKGGYSQALEKARKDLRFMLVILTSDDHDDTAKFSQETLCSQRIIDYIKEKNILVWAGNVRESESHKVSYALQATMYPFMALIALQTSLGQTVPKMTVIERMEGPSHPEELISQIDIAIERHGAVVNRLRNEKSQREFERQLLKDQDHAYHQSLKADQEKARIAQEEKEALEREEEKAQLELQKLELLKEKRQHYIQYLLTQLPQEPTENQGVAKLSFRLANGDRVVRKFNKDDTVESLYRFVQVYPLLSSENEKVEQPPSNYTHQYKFTIHSPYPRMEYEPNNDIKLCDIKSLWPSATLIVDADEEEEEEGII